MKKEFFNYLFKLMKSNKDIVIIFAGLGYPRVDEFKKAFPDRAYDFQPSEQTCLDACVGLSYSGKIPVVYTITPFYWRAAETIRTFINYEKLNVKMIGAGRDDDYSKHDGFSHDASDVKELLGLWPNIEQFWPNKAQDLPKMVDGMINNNKPSFISLRR